MASPGGTPGLRAAVAGILLLCAGLASCREALAPEEVAAGFWAALKAGQIEQARPYVMRKDAGALGDFDVLPIDDYALGKIVIDGDRSTVATSIMFGEQRPVSIPLETLLRMEDGAWKIDYPATVGVISADGDLARMLSQIREFSAALKEGIDQSTLALERRLPLLQQELERLEREVQAQVPELRKRLKNFERRLRDALQPPPSPSPPAERRTILI